MNWQLLLSASVYNAVMYLMRVRCHAYNLLVSKHGIMITARFTCVNWFLRKSEIWKVWKQLQPTNNLGDYWFHSVDAQIFNKKHPTNGLNWFKNWKKLIEIYEKEQEPFTFTVFLNIFIFLIHFNIVRFSKLDFQTCWLLMRKVIK